jgi:cysteine-rich repeat protein
VRRAFAIAILCLLGRAAVAGADPVQVVILAGQSNAVGYGSDANLLPPALYAPQTDVRFWFDEGSFFSIPNPSLRIDSGDAFVPLKFQSDPSGLTFAGPVDGFGSEIKLGRLLADAFLADVAIVKFAVSGSSLAVDWNPATPGSFYHQMQNDVAGALAALAAAGDSGQVAAFFWMQGEADAQTGPAAAAYEANLTSFIAQVRADFGSAALPFVLGRINVNIDTSCCFSFPFKDAVRTAQANVAGAVPGTVMVDTDDLPLIADNLHFTAAGQLALGERFANAYLALPPVCGDGQLAAGEECDDGNLVDGDCCSAACLAEPAGGPCTDDGNACTLDQCSAVGSCAHTSIPNCPPEPDELVPGKTAVIRPATLARFVARAPVGGAFVLPGPGNDPTVEGGTIEFFDTLPGAGAATFALPPLGWKALGTPAGAKGFRYKGAGSPGDPCTVAIIKPRLVKAVCRGADVTVNPPLAGDLGVVLTAGTASKHYCAVFGGETRKNAVQGVVRRNAPAPVACPVAPPP